MIGLTLALMLVAPQDTPVWEKIESGDAAVAIEISGLRAEGDLQYLDVRVSAPGGTQAIVVAVVMNCKAGTSHLAGDGTLYIDGKVDKVVPTPSQYLEDQSNQGDPIAEPLAAHLCAK